MLTEGASLEPTSRGASRAWLLLAAMVLAALVLRLGVLWAVQPTLLAGDENDYFRRALRLLETGRMLGAGERAPLTEIYYAALFRVFGTLAVVARTGNALLSALTLIPVFVLGRSFGGLRSGLVAAALAALYPNFIAFSHYLWGETLYVFLVAWALALLALHAARPRLVLCALAGGLLGLAALTREVGALFPFFAAAWLYWLARAAPRKGAAHAAALLACAIAVVLPWTLHVNRQAEDFALITRTTGQNLYIGNVAPVEVPGQALPVAPFIHYWSLGSNRLEAEREAGRLARQAIAERMPWWPAEKLFEQVPRFFTPTSFAVRRLLVPPDDTGPDQTWSYRFRESLPDSPGLRWLAVSVVVAAYVAVLALGVVGLVLGRRRDLVALFVVFMAAQLLPALVTFAASRFRLASMVLLIVAAAPLLGREDNPFASATPARRKSALVAAAALLLLVLSRYEDALRSTWG
ncbi:MAG: glycosyltransferase family 39 protein [Deltaproteobacteria bacterium]|nr:glycosyltransferase family 39 protein [Deltaproteobacteria bacterium]